MFNLFGKQKEVQKAIAQSRHDTDVLMQWVRYLHEANKYLQDKVHVQQNLIDTQRVALHELQVTVRHMPKTAAEIKRIVDAYYDFNPIINRLKHIEDKISLLEMRKPEVKYVPKPAPQLAVVPPETPPKASALQEKLMRRIVQNSKDYIKKTIQSLVHKYGRISALQLREIIVEEQGLCSKSSFYRILEEMEREQSIAEVNDGKIKVFVPAV